MPLLMKLSSDKWQRPAGGGKDAVYAGCELEPMEWSATDVELLWYVFLA